MQQTFTSLTAWTMAHPWGNTHPFVIATNLDGSRTYLTGPEYSDGEVTVTFSTPKSGVLELLNPTGGGAELVDDLTSPASGDVNGSAAAYGASGATFAPLAIPQERPAVIGPGQGAVIQ